MAAAADAFRRANERTESLLDKSRELGLEVQASRRDLERSNQELEQFVYTVSHDLKTPLVTSLGFIGMMREMAAAGQLERAISKLDVLERSNRRMSRLIAELLDLSRVGRLDTEREDIDSGAAVRSVVEDLSTSRVRKKSHAVHNGALAMHSFVPHRSQVSNQLPLRALLCMTMTPFCIRATFSSPC